MATKASTTKERYIETVGRRKTAVARVRLLPAAKSGEGEIIVNKKKYDAYFPLPQLQKKVASPLEKLSLKGISISVLVKGGGVSAQAEAVRHGIARALVEQNPDTRKKLKKSGYLSRDSRMVERKKYGLKKARRAPQWSKR
jgi:small subunit ribosomal protein S9